MGENVFKFWTTGTLKELVVTISNEPILINTFFHFEIFLKTLVPREARFWKNRINHLITPSQAIGHKIFDLQTLSNSSKIRQQKMTSFWKNWYLVIWYASRLANSFKPAKPFPWAEQNPKTAIPWNHLWLMSWGMLTKIIHFSGILLSHIFPLDRNNINNLGPKSQLSKTILTLRRDASTWRTIYGMHRCPE